LPQLASMSATARVATTRTERMAASPRVSIKCAMENLAVKAINVGDPPTIESATHPATGLVPQEIARRIWSLVLSPPA
jgi:hypothetical protein